MSSKLKVTISAIEDIAVRAVPPFILNVLPSVIVSVVDPVPLETTLNDVIPLLPPAASIVILLPVSVIVILVPAIIFIRSVAPVLGINCI